MIVAKICNLKPGVFTHFLWDCHIYENQIDIMKNVQLKRKPRALPWVEIPDIFDLNDIGTLVMPEDIKLRNYDPFPAIKYPFSV